MDGVILKMEFLHPSKGDKDHVILLLVTSKKSKTRIRCYEWDSSTHVSEAAELGRGQRVPDDQQLPLLLIPLLMSTAFLLVFENRIATYTGILTGHATTHDHQLDHLEGPEEPGSSRAKPVFTQWARAMRREDHVSLQDNIYLCREDGVVRFLEISEEIRHMIDSSHAAGRLKANVNTAFASLDLGRQFNDLLVAGGDMSDGGLWTFAPRYGPTNPMISIANWTPTLDFVASHISRHPTRCSGHARTMGGQAQTQKRIFAPTGRGSTRGAVTEVRFGIEASLLAEVFETGKGVNQIWALYDCSGKGIHILISYPTHTVSFLAGSDDQLQDEDDEIQINTEAETLAAGLTQDGFVVQVTATSIRATQPGNHQRGLAVDLEDESFLKATILTSERYGCLLLVAVKAADELSLRWARISTDGPEVSIQSLGKPQALSAEPSCLSLQEAEGEIIALVGTLAGALQLFTRNGPSLQVTCSHRFEGEFAICNSIAMIQNASSFRLVCGLRNGSVQTLLLDASDSAGPGHVNLIPQGTIIMGNTSVLAITDENNHKRAIVACGITFCTLEYGPGNSTTSLLNKIWITHKQLPGINQEEIVAISQPRPGTPDGSSDFDAGQSFCVEGGQLRQIEISKATQPHMVPRRINLDGTPSKIIFSEKLGRLIVLYTRTVVVRPPQMNGHHFRAGQRSLQPVFGFLDPNKGLNRPDPTGIGNTQVLHEAESKRPANIVPVQECRLGEKFLGMTEWFPTDGSKGFHMLVVHTMLVHADNRAPTGRLIFFSLSKDQNNNVAMAWKKSTDLKAPVYAVAPYGSSSLVYSCGNNIHLHTLDMSSVAPRWLAPITFPLRSRGTHISVNAPLLHVTTANESLSVLKVEEAAGNREEKTSLVFQYSDEIARDGIFHLEIPDQGLLLTSSKDCMVSGLWMPPERRINNCLSTVFKADLRGSITRFRQLARSAEPADMSEDKWVDGRLTDPILGSSSDGTFYQMDILDEPSWRLLRFIVNMAKRHPVICPFRDTYNPAVTESRKPHIEPSAENRRQRHVDGDILVRLLERGAEGILGDMLQREPGDDDQVVDFDTASARQKRFQELMVDAGLGQSSLTALVKWLRRLLASAL